MIKENICKICNKKFKNKRGLISHLKKHKLNIEEYYLKYIGKKTYCEYCGKETKFSSLENGYQTFCSRTCANKSPKRIKNYKQICLKRYGVENPSQLNEIKEKKKQSTIKHYGVEHLFQLPEFKEKYKKICLKKYGVEHPLQSDIIKEKKKQTCLEKYDVEHPFRSEEIKNKIKNTMLEKYNVPTFLQSKEFKEKYKKTCLERYGYESHNSSNIIKEKKKETCLEKYGVEHVLQLKEFKEKVKKTNLEKYGVEHIFQLPEFKEKTKQTCLERYGVVHQLQCEEIKEKVKKTNLEKYGVKTILQLESFIKSNNIKRKKKKFISFFNSDRFKNKVKPNFSLNEYKGCDHNNKYSWTCTKCNNEFKDHIDDGRIPRCPTCYSLSAGFSLSEKEISNFCKKYYPHLIENSRSIIPPLELDIYIPEKKLAIEFDGLYWHSDYMLNDPNYHLNKTQLCEKKGIQLIHIFEDEWLNKQDIVESIIKSKLGIYDQKIYARKTEFKSVSQDESDEFLFDNHLQGSVRGQNFGLYHNNELISLITVGKPRYNKDYKYELYRFCNKKNIQVIGGLSKLIKNFQKSHTGSIISYCDRRYSNGNGYLNSGFVFVNKTSPSYFHIKNYQKYNRLKFQKHKLEEQLEIYDPNLTEWQNMQLNDYDRIFDCGNLIFENSQG
jgi:hypothetical protein